MRVSLGYLQTVSHRGAKNKDYKFLTKPSLEIVSALLCLKKGKEVIFMFVVFLKLLFGFKVSHVTRAFGEC